MAEWTKQDDERVQAILGDEAVRVQAAEALRLATGLKGLQRFAAARNVITRVPKEGVDPALKRKLAQVHALCTYKDPDLPTDAKLDRALKLLQEADELTVTTDQETLGLAGAIFKNKWEADANPQHLERGLAYYLRGYQVGPAKDQGYTGINAAFILDLLAHLDEKQAKAAGSQPLGTDERREKATTIREHLVRELPVLLQQTDLKWLEMQWWFLVTVAEAYFGLGQYPEALSWLKKAKALKDVPLWEVQSTARQLARLAGLTELGDRIPEGAQRVLAEFVGSAETAQSLLRGKVGLALSGGGFRASLFHLGVLARLAELDMLRHIEVLSCVSGGSIVGAHYYLEIRKLLQARADSDSAITRKDYVELVERVAEAFLKGVQHNLRTRVVANPLVNLKMIWDRSYSRTQRLGELFEKFLYAKVEGDKEQKPIWLNQLLIRPLDHAGKVQDNFNPKIHNWKRRHKVPALILNATTLNTGHNWQFTATYMGEPPGAIDTQIDGNYRLRRLYYDRDDTPERYRQMRLGHAVAASACVPGLFEPITLPDLYEGKTVRLVDGGVHDNQGVAGLLEQGCTVLLVSDASGQMNADDDPSAGVIGVPLRANSILQSRIRGAGYQNLESRRKAALLRGVMFVHLKKGLSVDPIPWKGCAEMPDRDWEPPQQEEPLPYGIQKAVQRGLSGIRTDLDSFSQTEAYALMTSGYRMTDWEFERTIKEFPISKEHAHDWSFLAIEPEMAVEPQSSNFGRLIEVARHTAFKVWKLSGGLRIISHVTVAAIVLAIGWMGYTHSADVLLSGKLNLLGKSVEQSLTWGGVASVLATLLLTPFVGKGLMGKMGVIRQGELVNRWAVGVGIGLVGWIAATLHLYLFDKLFLKYGRLREDKKGSDETVSPRLVTDKSTVNG
ncbi:MAG: patatin-like phospholipase family protein [Nitrospira sp.]|nr:patatin-like phospholipase family protein [Nitrospira sp.]